MCCRLPCVYVSRTHLPLHIVNERKRENTDIRDMNTHITQAMQIIQRHSQRYGISFAFAYVARYCSNTHLISKSIHTEVCRMALNASNVYGVSKIVLISQHHISELDRCCSSMLERHKQMTEVLSVYKSSASIFGKKTNHWHSSLCLYIVDCLHISCRALDLVSASAQICLNIKFCCIKFMRFRIHASRTPNMARNLRGAKERLEAIHSSCLLEIYMRRALIAPQTRSASHNVTNDIRRLSSGHMWYLCTHCLTMCKSN